MTGSRMDQLPCPYRIVDDVGAAFSMGSIGGGVWYFFKGLRNAPPNQKLRSAITKVMMRSPVLGGSFAVWGFCFSSYDCILLHSRGKDDPLNAVASGALTGATLAFRSGPRAALMQGAIGGLFLAMIEGLSVVWAKQMQKTQASMASGMAEYTPFGKKDELPPAPKEISHIEYTDDMISNTAFDKLDDGAEFEEDFSAFEYGFGDKFEDDLEHDEYASA